MLNEVKEIALRFLDSYFPDCYGAILTGSQVIGNNEPNSDIDIVIFEEDINNQITPKNVVFEGYRIDACIVSTRNIISILQEYISKPEVALTNLIAFGIPIKENKGNIQELISFCKSIKCKHYPSLTDEELRSKTNQIYQSLGYLQKKNFDFGGRHYIISSITHIIFILILNANKAYYQGLKQRSTIVKKMMPHFYERLMCEVRLVYISDDTKIFNYTPLIEIINFLLNKLGLLSSDFSQPLSNGSFKEAILALPKANINVNNLPKLFGSENQTNAEVRFLYFYYQRESLILYIERRDDVPILKVKSFLVSYLTTNTHHKSITEKSVLMHLTFANEKLIKLINSELTNYFQAIHKILRELNNDLPSSEFTIGGYVFEEVIKFSRFSNIELNLFLEELFLFWSSQAYDTIDKNDDIALVKLRKKQFLEYYLKNNKDINFDESIKNSPTLVKNSLDRYFSSSFSVFVEKIEDLRTRAEFELPTFLLNLSLQYQLHSKSKSIIFRMILEKFFEILDYKDYYQYPIMKLYSTKLTSTDPAI